MAGFFGGATDRMREQAQACGRGGEQLTALVETISGVIDGVTWEGPDAEAFREHWYGALRSELLARGAEAQQRARELDAHAEEQDAASREDGEFAEIIQGLPVAPIPGLGPQEFYGGPGYGGRGLVFGEDRPVGEQFLWNQTAWDGREIDNSAGILDGYAGVNYSAGAGSTTDPYGNITGSVGARGSAEIGLDAHADLPGDLELDAGARAGVEAYAEAGGTIGPDGFSAGASAGSGLYGELTAELAHESSGASVGMTQSYFVGADAHATAYSHVTRSDEGEENGWTVGFDAGAFSGAAVTQEIAATSPDGWFSGSASVGAQAGYDAGLSAGGTVSTDDVSVSIGGSLAAELGLSGATTIGVHPNAIVDSFTPGDYDLDDAIDDASGALVGAGGWISDHSPF